MLKLAIAILFLIPNVALGATIYIDGRLAVNCSSNNYSISNRTCTGKDGNAYNNIQSAFTASAANDTIYFRTGSYTVNTATNDITPKNGQTWAQYSGDTPRSATITAHPSGRRVFEIYGSGGVQNVTVRDLTVVGGICWGIHIASTNGAKVINNEVRGWNNQAVDESGCAGIGITAYDTQNAVDPEVTDNYVHSPVLAASDNAAIHVGGSGSFTVANGYIARNRVVGTRYGIWMDVNACDPARGATPCRIEENYLKTPARYCFLSEIGSTGYWRKNICDTPGVLGIYYNMRDVANSGAKIQNNTFYNVQEVGIWIGGAGGGTPGAVTNLLVENNIIYSTTSNSVWPLLNVSQTYIGVTSNRYRNNLLHAVNNNVGICWSDNPTATTGACDSPPATIYADSSAGISSWQAAAPSGVASGNIAGNPLFANPAGEDFRLCTGVGAPVASCTGKSPAIDAGANVGLSFQGLAPDIGAIESGASSGGPLLAAPTSLRVTQ